MNFSTEDSDTSDGVLFVNFNQVATSICVGTKNGFKIYDLVDASQLSPIYECYTKEDVCIVERLYQSSLVGVVSLVSPRKLTFYNLTNNAEICEKHFPNTILSLKLNRKAFVVCMEENLQILDFIRMNPLYLITNTPPNPNGLCALSAGNEFGFLAYPGSTSVGDIQIFDVNSLQAKISIPAHSSPVIALAFNWEGNMIATASVKGTVIRVFNTTSGQNLFDFRRGLKRCVTIHSLSFDKSSDLLCASSNTETVHIFKLSSDVDERKMPDEAEGWMDVFGKVLTQTATYLPYQVSDVLTQQRAFINIHLPISGLKTICRITKIKHVHHLVLVSSDGFVFMYSLDAETGAFTLAKQHRLDGRVNPELCASNDVTFHKNSPSSSIPKFRKAICNSLDQADSYSLCTNYPKLSGFHHLPENQEKESKSSSSSKNILENAVPGVIGELK